MQAFGGCPIRTSVRTFAPERGKPGRTAAADYQLDVTKKSLFLRRIWQKKPEISKTVKQGVRIPPAPPVRYKVWHVPTRRAYAVGGEQIGRASCREGVRQYV